MKHGRETMTAQGCCPPASGCTWLWPLAACASCAQATLSPTPWIAWGLNGWPTCSKSGNQPRSLPNRPLLRSMQHAQHFEDLRPHLSVNDDVVWMDDDLASPLDPPGLVEPRVCCSGVHLLFKQFIQRKRCNGVVFCDVVEDAFPVGYRLGAPGNLPHAALLRRSRSAARLAAKRALTSASAMLGAGSSMLACICPLNHLS